MLVRIKGTVITSQYGALADGTLLRTNEAFAKHLVEDAFAAEYVVNKEEPQEPVEAVEPTEKKRGRPAKE
jgi:hypothetical protein